MSSRKRVIRLFAAGLMVVLSGVLVTACGGGGSDSSGGGSSGGITKVPIAGTQWIGYGPFYIADAKGFDKDNGVDIKEVGFASDDSKETAFVSGKFQAANIATNNTIRMAELDARFKVVMMEDFSLTADAILTCDPAIKSIKDLAGKKVAYEEFSVSDVLFRYALKQAGIDFDSVDYVPIPASDAGAAVVAGRVDVAVTYQPYLQAAVAEDSNCHILYTAGERPGLISDGLVVNADFADSNPDAVVGVMKAWDDAVAFYRSDPKEAKAIISRALGASPKSLESSFKGVKLFSLKESQDFLETDYPDLWSEIGGIMKEQGQIKAVPDVSEYLDTGPGSQALGK